MTLRVILSLENVFHITKLHFRTELVFPAPKTYYERSQASERNETEKKRSSC